MMALQRFVNRSSGLLGQTADGSLESLGLSDICPTHYHRPLELQLTETLLVAQFPDFPLCIGGSPVTLSGVISDAPARSYTRTLSACHAVLLLCFSDLSLRSLPRTNGQASAFSRMLRRRAKLMILCCMPFVSRRTCC